MRILITGSDGYEGWPLTMHLAAQGHDVTGVDNYARRKWVEECSSHSVIPITPHQARSRYAAKLGATMVERTISGFLSAGAVVKAAKPEVVIHLAEQPSAPYSMMSAEKAAYTCANNFGATVSLLWALREHAPDAHLIYVSTMGEYGTPAAIIPEGVFADGRDCVKGATHHGWTQEGDLSGMSFPRKPGSFYHVSKVSSGAAVEFASRAWGLTATTLYQGVVAGIGHPQWTEPTTNEVVTRTRFDVDEAFGTVFNRFCAQAVLGIPMTLYGTGEQQRGFISLFDAVLSLEAAVEAPPETGTHRHCNQLTEIFTMRALTEIVRDARAGDCKIAQVPNPRVEAAAHGYDVATDNFRALYPETKVGLHDEVGAVLGMLEAHRDRLEEVRDCIAPKTQWKAGA